MLPKFIRRDAEQRGSLEENMANTTDTAAVVTTPENGTPANTVDAPNASAVEQPTTDTPVTNPANGENPNPDNTVEDDAGEIVDNEPFDEARWRNTLRKLRENERAQEKRIKELSTQLEEIDQDRSAARRQLLSFEEQQAIEQNKLKELAESRGTQLTTLEQEAAQRQRDYENRLNTLNAQSQKLSEEVHKLVDSTTAEWPSSIKSLIPSRKDASAEARLEFMHRVEPAAREIMDKPVTPGNGPLGNNSPQVPNKVDDVRRARANRMYDNVI